MYNCDSPPEVNSWCQEGVQLSTTIGDSTRPAFVSDGHLDYLDHLFDSYGIDARRAPRMLCTAFRLGEQEAEAVAKFWSSTFGRRLTGS